MSIIDFIKGLFSGEPIDEANLSANVVEDESVNSDVCTRKRFFLCVDFV